VSFAKFHCYECHSVCIILLSVALPLAIQLGVILLGIILLIVVLVKVVAPAKDLSRKVTKLT